MAAKTIRNAVDQNLALFVKDTSSRKNVKFILYDPQMLLGHAKNVAKFNKETRPNGGSQYGFLDHQSIAIYGKVEIQLLDKVYDWSARRGHITKNMDFPYYKICGSACRDGYGPLVYDIAMSYAGVKGLAPDLTLSNHARKIWTHYFDKREDVIPYEIPERMKERTFAQIQFKCSYVIKNKRRYKTLKENHDKFIADLRRATRMGKTLTERKLEHLGDYFM